MSIPEHFHRGFHSLLHWRASRKAVFRVSGWLALLYATLALAQVSNSWSGALCGPWGCTAPLEAVAACHIAWAVLLAPLVMGIVRQGTRTQRFMLGISLVTFAVATLLVLCGLSLAESQAIPSGGKYVVQRMALKVVGFVDLPVFAALAFGVWCLWTIKQPPGGAFRESANDNLHETGDKS